MSVILLDLRMPIMNGWDFLKVRQHEPWLTSIPVVITSAEIGGATRELGVDAIFSKPLDLPKVIACVRKFAAPGRPSA